jgi:hypothetical protein
MTALASASLVIIGLWLSANVAVVLFLWLHHR